jgi:alpha-tubulin suppressor-like RCC1 family protein
MRPIAFRHLRQTMARWALPSLLCAACSARPLDLPEPDVATQDLAAPANDLGLDLAVSDLASPARPDLASPARPDLALAPDMATRRVVQISAGAGHACAIVDGAATCWGNNGVGELGNGTTVSSSVPVHVMGLPSGLVAISAGNDHSCALGGDGAVYCWGENQYGQLGDGTTRDSHVPVAVTGLSSRVIAISAGYFFTCALTVDGAISCWGADQGALLSAGQSSTPVTLSGFPTTMVTISSGGFAACALTSTNAAICWGDNNYGQLGDGTLNSNPTLVSVSGFASGAGIVSAGLYSTCGVVSGAAKCWGSNSNGQLGNGVTGIDSLLPVSVSSLGDTIAISTGYFHACAVTSDGAAHCWGRNDSGALGDGMGSDSSLPVDVNGLSSGVVSISAGFDFTCATTTAGGAKCWGFNGYGQLGNGTTTNSRTPVDVRL